MRLTRRIIVGSVALLTLTLGASLAQPQCDAPELISSQTSYNDKVCTGIEWMEAGKPQKAVASFEEALSIAIPDLPNFLLLPRLALALHQAGETERAQKTLKKAELALKVYTRMLHCSEEASGFSIVRNSMGRTYTIDSPHHDEIASIMCGAAYDSLYSTEDLSANLEEARLVKHYLSIKEQMAASQ